VSGLLPGLLFFRLHYQHSSMALHLSNSSLYQASIRASSIGRKAGHESLYSRFRIMFYNGRLQCVDVHGGFIHTEYG
jgi:hypothetical protein